MAIAFDAAGSISISSGSILSLTQAVNGANRIIFAGFNIVASDGTLQASPSFNGTAMTLIERLNSTYTEASLWYYLNPPAATGTIQGTITVPPATADILCSTSCTGVNQTTPIAGSVSGLASFANSGSIISSLSANNWFVGVSGIDYGDQSSDTTTGQINRSFKAIASNSN